MFCSISEEDASGSLPHRTSVHSNHRELGPELHPTFSTSYFQRIQRNCENDSEFSIRFPCAPAPVLSHPAAPVPIRGRSCLSLLCMLQRLQIYSLCDIHVESDVEHIQLYRGVSNTRPLHQSTKHSSQEIGRGC